MLAVLFLPLIAPRYSRLSQCHIQPTPGFIKDNNPFKSCILGLLQTASLASNEPASVRIALRTITTRGKTGRLAVIPVLAAPRLLILPRQLLGNDCRSPPGGDDGSGLRFVPFYEPYRTAITARLDWLE